MKFNIRRLNQNDYDQSLKKWWKSWGWTAPPKDFLPENGTGGLMVSKGNIDICAGFIYLTNSKVALTEFVVSNKNYKEKDRSEAIQLLIDGILFLAEEKGYKYAHVILKNKSLLSKYKKSGYLLSDDNVTEMLKVWH